MHAKSGVGHVGGNLSCLDALIALHHRVLRPEDRFLLSKGHAAGAYYATLWSMGRLCDADLDTFHGENTRLPGHVPSSGIEEVFFATGSLGHGLSLAAGAALATRFTQSARRVYCLTSDGEWQEGSTWEALIFAVHQRLANLVVLVDANGWQGFGRTSEVASLEPLAERLVGFGVVPEEVDGHDPEAIVALLATRAPGAPRVVVLRTVKGKGVPGFEDTLESHYVPLSAEALRAALARSADA